MGDRSNIIIVYENDDKIGFYTHWGGSHLPNTLKDALIRGKNRWDDESYLARIIFSEMIKEEILEETGYGIYPVNSISYEEDHSSIYVFMKKKEVSIGQIVRTFEDYIKQTFVED